MSALEVTAPGYPRSRLNRGNRRIDRVHTLENGTRVVIREPVGDDALVWDSFVAAQQAATYGGAVPADFVERSLARVRDREQERRLEFDRPGTSVRRIAFAGDLVVGVAEVGDGPEEWETELGIGSIGIRRELVRLYLAPEAKGTGLASTMFDLVAGDDALYLWIINGNDRAHRFYLKHGFTDVDELVSAGETWGSIPMHRMVRSARLGPA